MGEGCAVPVERLADYRAIDPGVAMGHMPVAKCLDLQALATYQELGPGGQYDRAWTDLETSVAIAMPGAIDPETGRHFIPKQKTAARNQAKTQFRIVAQDEQASPGLRARAMIAGASVDMQHTMSRGIILAKGRNRDQIVHQFKPEHIPFLTRIQTAAKLLLAETDRTPEDEALLRAMASMAVMTECLSTVGWIVPAPPRQPWDINAVLRGVNKWSHVVVDSEAPTGTDILNLPVETLGDELWDESAVPHTTLNRYLALPPGFAARSAHAAERKVFDNIADRHIGYLRGHTPVIPSAPPRFSGVAVGSAAESAESPPKHPEVAWYKAQSARDFRSISPLTLRVQVLNLEDAHSHEPLDHFARHTLGWMQMDQAYAITLQAKEKRTDAEGARTQAGRASQFDARAHNAIATAADEAADKLISEAKERYDTAIDTLKATADSIMTTRPGEAYHLLLNTEAGYVYKALFTESDPAMLEEVIDTYVRRLGAFYTPMRTIEKNLKASHSPHDLDQLDALHAAGLKAALCLLVGDSSDEAARDLALPASLRSGGMQAQMDVVVFPKHYDGETDAMSYNTETPIHIQLGAGRHITHERLYVSLGWDLLMPQKDPLGRLAKLVATTSIRKFGPKRPSETGPSSGAHKKRGKKGKGPKKPQVRRESVDELGFMVSDAIADAQDY